MRIATAVVSLSLMVSACDASHGDVVDAAAPGNDATSTMADVGPTPIDAGHPPVDANIPGSATRSVAIGPFVVASSVEQTLCVTVDLGNDTPMMLRAVHTHITSGSHHLVVSRGTAIQTTPTPCAPLAHGVGEAIFIAESHESGLEYPSYAGLPMAAHQPIGLELHMIDLSPDSENIGGTVDFDLVPVDPSIREVHILFTGNMSLDLPAHRETVVSSTFPMAPGAEVLAMTTHTHQLGVSATLDVTPNASLPGTRVVESMSWSDPPLVLFDPPLVIGATDMVRLTCTFDNNTDGPVGFGTSFNDEMCFFWAYYLEPL